MTAQAYTLPRTGDIWRDRIDPTVTIRIVRVDRDSIHVDYGDGRGAVYSPQTVMAGYEYDSHPAPYDHLAEHPSVAAPQERRWTGWALAALIVAVCWAMFGFGVGEGIAHAATPHQPYVLRHGTVCRIKGYHVKITRKRHKRIVECVYKAPPAKPNTPAAQTPAVTPPSTPAAPTPDLAVTLDPSFTQNATNPLDVTYSYSASATVSGVSLGQQAELPDGVLEFFNNGQLACSTNVGGGTTGGTCEVAYPTFGDQTVDVVYDSGADSTTTGNQSELVEPPAPTAPYGTQITVTPQINLAVCTKGAGEETCTGTIEAALTDMPDQWGDMPPVSAGLPPVDGPFAFTVTTATGQGAALDSESDTCGTPTDDGTYESCTVSATITLPGTVSSVGAPLLDFHVTAAFTGTGTWAAAAGGCDWAPIPLPG